MAQPKHFLLGKPSLSRRTFISLSGAGLAATRFWPDQAKAEPVVPALANAIEALDPFFTTSEKFRDVSRGKPLPHALSEEKKRKVGLTRDTWKLEVVSDPQNPAKIRHPLTKSDGTALDFAALVKLGETRAVRFAKTMTCLNIGCPLG